MTVNDILKGCSVWLPSKDYDNLEPKVTVVLPTFRRGKDGYFKRAVDSVLNQTFRRLELIIVDDCSTDGTFNQIRDYMEKDSRVSCIRHTFNVGLPAISQYEAYLKARGKYIAYIFDDNEWYEDAIAQTYDIMVEEGLKATFGITDVYNPQTDQFFELGDPDSTQLQLLDITNLIGNGSVVLHRDVIETVGLYDPHLALTRNCDWDLWVRIKKKYELKGTGFRFTKEFGPALKDSLGNSLLLDSWIVAEYRQHRDESLLLPAKFHMAEIIDQSGARSDHYIKCMEAHIQQYKLKAWFDSERMTELKLTVCQNHRRVLIALNEVGASYMSFYRLRCNEITIRYVFNEDYYLELPTADVLIVGRLLNTFLPVQKLAKQCGIPSYYYLDDNFIEIARCGSNDAMINMISKNMTQETLADFSGIIVSSTEMIQYFKGKNLHKNLILLEPVIDPMLIRPVSCEDKPVTIAFMGGTFRNNMLNTCILPALERLSIERSIQFYCPKDDNETLKMYRSDRLEIYEIPRSANLDYVLFQYGQHEIRFLIHCGENIVNNRYKTKNAMINAVTLGAVLITSDIEPYCFKDRGEPTNDYVVSDNSPDAWYETLKTLIDMPERCTEIYETAKAYCLNRFGEKQAWTELLAELAKKPGEGYYKYIKQSEQIITYLLRQGVVRSTTFCTDLRPYVPESLCTSGHFRKARKYGITCNVDTLREIGLLFALFGNCTGVLAIKICQKGKVISGAEIRLEHIQKNGYTNILLDQPVKCCIGKRLIVELDFRYSEKNGHVEPFELRKNRTFWYKVFNKLGHPLAGKDALFVDCRE